jgi:two-component system CheB/CheR fusion protein
VLIAIAISAPLDCREMSERSSLGHDAPATANELPTPDAEPAPAPHGAAAASPTVVVVGASAGGLEALLALFGALSAPTGFAFVVVQHLAAQQPSSLAEILARGCAMPVADAVDGGRLAADHVLVMPSHADLEVHGDAVHLVAREPGAGLHLPIDRCLESVAAPAGRSVIAVILSGDGRDGANGLVTIHAAGGLVLAQQPASAAHPAMPQAAIDTGCVDLVLPVAAIAAELVRLSQHPELQASGGTSAATDDAAALQQVFSALQHRCHIDFAVYRSSTIRRRIGRRQVLRGHPTLAAYAAALADDATECAALQRDLLIGVTQFFREPATFAAIGEQLLPELLRGRQADDPIRIWVPGCSTGEEAFSLAIVVHEYLQSIGSAVPVQIYASDVNPAAIAMARSGRFPPRIAAAVGPERLARWFQPTDDGYQIATKIRATCVFTVHNLLADPPFSRLDLISCRNVLMYLVGVQATMLRLFHYALKVRGYLVLGTAESPDLGDAFLALERAHGLYARRPTARRAVPLPSVPRKIGGGTGLVPLYAGADGTGEDSLRRRVDRLLLARFGPAAVLVGGDLEVLEIRGDVRDYLALPAGQVSYHLGGLMPTTGLFLQVEALVRQACRDGAAVAPRPVVFVDGATTREVVLEVVPMQGAGIVAALVLFDPPQPAPRTAPATGPAAPVPGDGTARTLVQLAAQVAEAHEHLREMAARHREIEAEAASAAEEAMSANEELRSLNEELETAKEELQSSNEELQTANGELEQKNAALRQARDQALSILGTLRQPLLALDEELRVVTSNAAFHRLFGMTPMECDGQRLASLGGGCFDAAALHSMLDAARGGDAGPKEVELGHDAGGRGRRTLTMSAARIPGRNLLLLAIEDVTQQRLDAAALHRAEEHLRQTQKMEAIGRLAGGIAHDFNNVLTIVQGCCDLLSPLLAADAGGHELVQMIQGASARASALTRQLLAFGRRQVLQPKVVTLDGVLGDFAGLLRRLAGETIRCVIETDTPPWCVRLDPAEFVRVLMNLALNARDAMPNGGVLTLRCKNVVVAAGDEPTADLPPGRCVLVEVEDTGIGMDATAQARLFEPFFTTKAASHGSGLGLATVLGIVQQSGGTIRCRSTLGVGTCFSVWLPAVMAAADLMAAPRETAAMPRGNEVVLLVEDEPVVRALYRQLLANSGYTVLEAANGQLALAVAAAHGDPIALLVTDVMMPELGGVDLYERLRRLRPTLAVLFMSGYTPDDRVWVAVAAGAGFLQKPFSAAALTAAVRAAIDGDRTA